MFKQLLSVFLESKCPLCDRTAKQTICTYCQQKLDSYRFAKPDRWWQGELPLFAWGKYDGQLKRAIATMKYDSRSEIGLVLGKCLAESWLKIFGRSPKMTVVPVPLHPKKQQTRGFNQAEIIAKSFCQQTGYLLQPNILQRKRNTKAMFGLNPLERKQNITDAFELGQQIPKYPILLLDDVHTSGATTIEATKFLTSSGYKVNGVAVIAKAERLLNKFKHKI